MVRFLITSLLSIFLLGCSNSTIFTSQKYTKLKSVNIKSTFSGQEDNLTPASSNSDAFSEKKLSPIRLISISDEILIPTDSTFFSFCDTIFLKNGDYILSKVSSENVRKIFYSSCNSNEYLLEDIKKSEVDTIIYNTESSQKEQPSDFNTQSEDYQTNKNDKKKKNAKNISIIFLLIFGIILGGLGAFAAILALSFGGAEVAIALLLLSLLISTLCIRGLIKFLKRKKTNPN